MDTKEKVLQNCIVEGTVIKLPDGQLERKLYQEVAKSLELIGGKWVGRSTMGFVFPTDPTELLEQIANGENRNLKKEFQFFGTPDSLCDELVQLSEINNLHSVLEPSAGQGAIINAIHRKYGKGRMVHVFELMPTNQIILRKISRVDFLGDDFLSYNPQKGFMGVEGFDRIIANPPFSKNQDIDHVRKMYDVLKVGGRLVSIVSTHWQMSNNKKETEFKNWLKQVGAVIKEVPVGAFKESGTNVKTLILIINK